MGAQVHFPELLSCNQRGRRSRPSSLGPQLSKSLPWWLCVYLQLWRRQKTRGKTKRKETHPHFICLLSEGGRALDPFFTRGPGSSLGGTSLRDLKCLQWFPFRIRTEAAAAEISSVDWLPASCSGIHQEVNEPVGFQASALMRGAWFWASSASGGRFQSAAVLGRASLEMHRPMW